MRLNCWNRGYEQSEGRLIIMKYVGQIIPGFSADRVWLTFCAASDCPSDNLDCGDSIAALALFRERLKSGDKSRHSKAKAPPRRRTPNSQSHFTLSSQRFTYPL